MESVKKNIPKLLFFVQLSCLVAVFIFFSGLYFLLSVPPKLQITACDVGQGDAVLIQYGQSFVLIDVGPNSSVLRCLQAELSVFDPVLDLVVLTHPDKDHIGGWESVENHYVVKNLWTNGQEKNSTQVNSNFVVPQTGDLLRSPGMMMSVVWHRNMNDIWEGKPTPEENTNERSIGLFLATHSFGFLSLGDLGCREELAVTSIPLLKDPTILKTSHHGSKTSSCEEFLEKIHPETAIISVGEKNSYNHPEENVLLSLEKLGIVVYRTDYQGKISFHLFVPGLIYVEPERSR